MRRPIGSYVGGRDNNFDVLRLGAASLVLVSHTWALTDRPEPAVRGNSLGAIGVFTFFAISGFLVTRSWHLDPRVAAFAVKRVLRLWPALIVLVLLSAALVGPLFTNLPLGDYFGDPGTVRYVHTNIGLHTVYNLPGVFADNAGETAVNGSLWTLPVEVKAYVIVLLLGLAGLLRRPLVPAILIGLLVWVLVMSVEQRPRFIADALGGAIHTRLIITFVGGALLFALRDRIPLDWRLAVTAAIASWYVADSSGAMNAITWSLTIPYLVVFLAYRTPSGLRAVVRPGDLSYGIYLWAFPVQQCVVALIGADAAPGWVLLVAGPAVYLIAFASWRLVEAPALRLKRRVHVTAAPRPTPGLAPANVT